MESNNNSENTVLESQKDQNTKAFALDVLKETKTSQNQHGLRHGDYQRYRLYCSRRLQRIRKTLNFTHGKNKFQKKTIDVDNFSDPRFLLLVLVKAERCWAFAMQLKDDAAADLRVRIHMHKKLSKAVKHAQELQKLCNAKSDKKTILQAEAYAYWMNGNFLLEKENWPESLQQYAKARTIYEQLGKISDDEFKELCKQRLEEIEPSVRYCNYNLKGKRSDASLIDMKIESSGPGMDLLQAKLDSVISDSLKKQAETMKEIIWREKRIPVKNEKIRVLILSFEETLVELDRADNYDKKMSLFDKLFVSYNDAIRAIKDEIGLLASSKKTVKTDEENLTNLKLYVTYLKITKTAEKNLFLADSYERKLFGRNDNETDGPKKTVKPEDLIRIYEILFQNMQELADMKLNDPEQSKEIAAKTLSFKAFRCFYVALSYLYASKFSEAVSLLDRSKEQLRAARQHIDNCAQPPAEIVKKLEEIENRIRSYKSETHAKSFLETIKTNAPEPSEPAEPKEPEVTTETTKENEQEEEEIVVETQNSLLGKINTFDYSFAKSKQLISFPPALEPTKCKPLLFDLAFNSVEFPSLENRKKANKAGSGWFGFFKS